MMQINPFKAWRQVLLLAAWTVFFIIIGIMVYLIPGRWEQQERGKQAYIDNHKAELRANWNKE